MKNSAQRFYAALFVAPARNENIFDVRVSAQRVTHAKNAWQSCIPHPNQKFAANARPRNPRPSTTFTKRTLLVNCARRARIVCGPARESAPSRCAVLFAVLKDQNEMFGVRTV